MVQGVPLVAGLDAGGAGDTHVGEDVAVNDTDVAELSALDFGIASGLAVLAGRAGADVAVGGRADAIPFLRGWRQGADVRDFAGCGKRAFVSYLALCEPNSDLAAQLQAAVNMR